MKKFNIRVYGLCVNTSNEILLVNESYAGRQFTKFPGGGLEMGEGIMECLKREFMEELNWEIDVIKHFYTTDFFVKSAFDDSQIISVYYWVGKFGKEIFDKNFYWKSLEEIRVVDLTFPIDKKVVKMILDR